MWGAKDAGKILLALAMATTLACGVWAQGSGGGGGTGGGGRTGGGGGGRPTGGGGTLGRPADMGGLPPDIPPPLIPQLSDDRPVRERGITYGDAIEVAPGEYMVRFVVRDNITGHMGSVSAPLKVM